MTALEEMGEFSARANVESLSPAGSAATQCVLLAQRGVTGPAELFEGNKGFIQSIAGPFAVDWGQEGLDRVERMIVKRYNAEIHSQTAIEAALELQAAHGFDATEIEKVEVDVFDVAHRIIGGGEEGDKTLVFTKEDADHSLPYLIAVALLDHTVMLEQFAPQRLQREDVQTLLCRVIVRPVAAYSARFPEEMPSSITVTLNDGRVVSRTLPDYPGLHTRPPTWEDTVAKFTTLVAPHIADATITEIAEAVRDLAHIRVAELTRLFRSLRAPLHGPATPTNSDSGSRHVMKGARASASSWHPAVLVCRTAHASGTTVTTDGTHPSLSRRGLSRQVVAATDRDALGCRTRAPSVARFIVSEGAGHLMEAITQAPKRALFDFLHRNDRPTKPRTRAITEIRGPYMFEATDPEVFGWYIKHYGPDVNLFVDHSQVVQLEALRQGIWGTASLWGRVLTYRG